jgi:hypothetical protein
MSTPSKSIYTVTHYNYVKFMVIHLLYFVAKLGGTYASNRLLWLSIVRSYPISNLLLCNRHLGCVHESPIVLQNDGVCHVRHEDLLKAYFPVPVDTSQFEIPKYEAESQVA